MRVKALDPLAGPTDTPGRRDRVSLDDRGVTASRVVVVRRGEFVGVDERLESVDTALALETAHRRVQLPVDQPVQGRHRRSVSQVRLVLDHDGPSVEPANDDGAASREWATDQLLQGGEVVARRVAKRVQRQNSSVRTRRETNPRQPLDDARAGAAGVADTDDGATSG